MACPERLIHEFLEDDIVDAIDSLPCDVQGEHDEHHVVLSDGRNYTW